MTIFNLQRWEENKHSDFVKRYVEAMGFTHQVNRDPYKWWEVDKLSAGPDEDWNEWLLDDPSMANLLHEAQFNRAKDLHWAQKEYAIPYETAAQLVKSYIGYHPSYGGYLCQIGPYRSQGGGHGIEHIKTECFDKFHYYIWRKKKATVEDVAKSISKNIDYYKTAFGVTFEDGDFALEFKPPEPYDPTRQSKVPGKKSRQPRRKVQEYIDSLDPSNPQVKQFFHTKPMLTEGVKITLGSQGYVKILKQMMGPWYEKTIMEIAKAQGKNPNEIANNAYINLAMLEDVYDKAYQKWLEAKKTGEAAAVGMVPPPKFKDKSLAFTSGQNNWREIPTNKDQSYQIALKVEILKTLQQGALSATAIAEVMNNKPIRLEVNKKRSKQGKDPILITTEEVQRVLDKSNTEMQEKGESLQDLIQSSSDAITQLGAGRGYDDLKSAFEMCALYFAGTTLDKETHAKVGDLPPIIFDPPENFKNFTTDELKNFRIAKAGQEQAVQEGKEQATPEQMVKDIGEDMPEPKKEKKAPAPQPAVPSPAQSPAPEMSEEDKASLEELLGNTLQNLIKIAEDLDNNGKYADAEEVHKIIRKYAGRTL